MESIILKNKGNAKNLVIFDHHIVRNCQIHSFNKLIGKEIYLVLVDVNTVEPTEQHYFENIFETFQFNRKKIYIF